jgi:DNA-binding IscR family transcriptional regulator
MQEVRDATAKILDSTSLADMIARVEKMTKKEKKALLKRL